MEESVIIEVLPHFWNKTHFKIAIEETTGTKNANQTQEITADNYRILVERGIARWREVLHRNYDVSPFPNISQIDFEVLDEPDGNEDIQIQWWEFNASNGLAEFFPLNERVCNNSTVHIAKNKQDGIWHNPIQITSIMEHELGHVLGLGHVIRWGQNPFTNDLMITGTQIQPDPHRQISFLDLQVINDKFGALTNQQRDSFNSRYSIPISEWRAIK